MSKKRARPTGKNPRYVVIRITEDNDHDATIAFNVRAGVTFYNSLVSHDDYRRSIYEFEFPGDERLVEAIEREVLADLPHIEDAGDPLSGEVVRYAVCTVN